MRTVAFVVNDLEEFDFAPLLKRHLGGARVSVLDYFPETPEQFDLVVLWSYRTIVRHPNRSDNVIIFHSSNLPEGRGWAPIYNTLARNMPTYIVTGIKLAEPVDSGDVVVRARFPMLPAYTASALRRFDHELSILLAARVLDRFEGRPLHGRPQSGEGSYYPRRRPEENEIDVRRTFVDLIPHLRACESDHPAYFFHEGEKYLIDIRPARPAEFPEAVEIVFFD